MKKLLSQSYLAIYTLVIAMLFFSSESRATHFVAIDLYYTHLGGGTYKITLVAFGDCGSPSSGAFATLPNATPQICIFDSSDFFSSVILYPDTPTNPYYGTEITPVCVADTDLTQCTNPAYTIPGIKKFVYSGTFNLPRVSHYWRLIFNGDLGSSSLAGRAVAITNIIPPSTTALVDTIDNTYHTSSSPVFSIIPTPYYCLNQPDTYYPGAVDPDGDSLSFALVNGKNPIIPICTSIDTGVTYVSGYSGANPLAVVAGSFSMNSSNGLVSFTPNMIQRALVVYNVRKYRNDTFIGNCQREMTFLVWPCSGFAANGAYVAASTGTIVDSTHYSICAGTGAFSTTINAYEADTTNNIYVHAWGLPAGATITTINDSTNHPISTFYWTTAGHPSGTYVFYITYSDNACTFYGSVTKAFYVTILPIPGTIATITGNPLLCVGAADTLNEITSGGTWQITDTTIATIVPLALTSAIVTGINAGLDTVIYKISNLCGVDSVNFPITILAYEACSGAIDTGGGLFAMVISPNPSPGSFKINVNTGKTENASVTVTNMMGQSVKEWTIPTGINTELVLGLPSGIYNIAAKTATQLFTRRMVIIK